MRRLALLAVGIALLSPVALADYRQAESALQAGDLAAAIPLLAEEAKLGNPVAAFNLAKIYEDGALGTPDFQAAATYYRVAAELDTAPRFDGNALGPNAARLIAAAQMFGQFALGRLYEAGKGVPQDTAEAIAWYRRSADLGGAQAMLKLALLYRDGQPGLLPDPAQAGAYLRRAADLGSVAAMNELGRAYLKGAGLPANARAAAQWFGKAASLGSVEAEYNLGLLYKVGFEGQPDFIRAAEHFRRGADAGDGPSMLALGDLYAGGLGVPEDKIDAFVWFKLASERGLAEAAHKEAFLAQIMSPAELETANARYLAWRPGTGATAGATDLPAAGSPAPSLSVTTPDLPPLAPPEEPTQTIAEPLPVSTPSTAQPGAASVGAGSGQPQPGAKPFEPSVPAAD